MVSADLGALALAFPATYECTEPVLAANPRVAFRLQSKLSFSRVAGVCVRHHRIAMGEIKDIVELAMQLESRSKDRKDIETLRSIISLTQAVQASQADVVERDIRVMQENAQAQREIADLKRQLAEAQAEEIRIHCGIEFRRGKRTGNVWLGFCPKCHLPAADWENGLGVGCSSSCEWASQEVGSIAEALLRMTP